MVDTVAARGEAGRRLRRRSCFQPLMHPAEMRLAFGAQGLRNEAGPEARMN